jgi:hypothetical protein
MSPLSTRVYEVDLQSPAKSSPPSVKLGCTIGVGASVIGAEGVTTATGLLRNLVNPYEECQRTIETHSKSRETEDLR